MKKLIRRMPVVKKYIDIIVNIDDYKNDSSIAANSFKQARTFQPSVKKKFKISDEALNMYTDFLNCILEVIVRNGLKISKQYQSKKGYTYYIQVDHIGLVDGIDIKVRYMHSDIKALERMEIIRDLRLGKFDVLVGINLLREGLDIPEVSLVAILDADKEGFLRSERSLIQTIGRAARNTEGKVIMYADELTESMEKAITETNRK